MKDTQDDKKLSRLRQLVSDYSYPGRIDKNKLNELYDLLEWAINKYIRRGLSLQEVKDLLGEPHVTIGEAGESMLHWLYPCTPPGDKNELLASNEKWYWNLSFADQQLSVVEKRKWRLII